MAWLDLPGFNLDEALNEVVQEPAPAPVLQLTAWEDSAVNDDALVTARWTAQPGVAAAIAARGVVPPPVGDPLIPAIFISQPTALYACANQIIAYYRALSADEGDEYDGGEDAAPAGHVASRPALQAAAAAAAHRLGRPPAPDVASKLTVEAAIARQALADPRAGGPGNLASVGLNKPTGLDYARSLRWLIRTNGRLEEYWSIAVRQNPHGLGGLLLSPDATVAVDSCFQTRVVSLVRRVAPGAACANGTLLIGVDPLVEFPALFSDAVAREALHVASLGVSPPDDPPQGVRRYKIIQPDPNSDALALSCDELGVREAGGGGGLFSAVVVAGLAFCDHAFPPIVQLALNSIIDGCRVYFVQRAQEGVRASSALYGAIEAGALTDVRSEFLRVCTTRTGRVYNALTLSGVKVAGAVIEDARVYGMTGNTRRITSVLPAASIDGCARAVPRLLQIVNRLAHSEWAVLSRRLQTLVTSSSLLRQRGEALADWLAGAGAPLTSALDSFIESGDEWIQSFAFAVKPRLWNESTYMHSAHIADADIKSTSPTGGRILSAMVEGVLRAELVAAGVAAHDIEYCVMHTGSLVRMTAASWGTNFNTVLAVAGMLGQRQHLRDVHPGQAAGAWATITSVVFDAREAELAAEHALSVDDFMRDYGTKEAAAAQCVRLLGIRARVQAEIDFRRRAVVNGRFADRELGGLIDYLNTEKSRTADMQFTAALVRGATAVETRLALNVEGRQTAGVRAIASLAILFQITRAQAPVIDASSPCTADCRGCKHYYIPGIKCGTTDVSVDRLLRQLTSLSLDGAHYGKIKGLVLCHFTRPVLPPEESARPLLRSLLNGIESLLLLSVGHVKQNYAGDPFNTPPDDTGLFSYARGGGDAYMLENAAGDVVLTHARNTPTGDYLVLPPRLCHLMYHASHLKFVRYNYNIVRLFSSLSCAIGVCGIVPGGVPGEHANAAALAKAAVLRVEFGQVLRYAKEVASAADALGVDLPTDLLTTLQNAVVPEVVRLGRQDVATSTARLTEAAVAAAAEADAFAPLREALGGGMSPDHPLVKCFKSTAWIVSNYDGVIFQSRLPAHPLVRLLEAGEHRHRGRDVPSQFTFLVPVTDAPHSVKACAVTRSRAGRGGTLAHSFGASLDDATGKKYYWGHGFDAPDTAFQPADSRGDVVRTHVLMSFNSESGAVPAARPWNPTGMVRYYLSVEGARAVRAALLPLRENPDLRRHAPVFVEEAVVGAPTIRHIVRYFRSRRDEHSQLYRDATLAEFHAHVVAHPPDFGWPEPLVPLRDALVPLAYVGMYIMEPMGPVDYADEWARWQAEQAAGGGGGVGEA